MIVKELADLRLALSFVVKEHKVLRFLFIGRFGHIDRLHGFGVDASVVHLGAERHRRGCEILNLFQSIAKVVHLNS